MPIFIIVLKYDFKIEGGIFMKKIKNMLKKGGVADVVTLIVIIGLVIALIIAVVLPIVRNSRETGNSNLGGLQTIDTNLGNLAKEVDGKSTPTTTPTTPVE